MSTKLPQWTGAHPLLKKGDLHAGCNQGINQHAAYVGGARMIMAAAVKPTPFMIETYERLVSLCQCTPCVVRRLRKEGNRLRHPRTKTQRFFGHQLRIGRKLHPAHALGCLIRKPCDACESFHNLHF